MALGQLLGITCLTLHFLIFSVSVYGFPGHSRELHMKPQDPFRNYTSHLSSGSAAAASSWPSTLNSEKFLPPQMTPSSDQTHKKAGAVLERPRPLHKFVLGDNALLDTLLSRSSVTFTPTSAGSLCSFGSLDRVLSTSRGNAIASRSTPVSASVYIADPRVVWPFNAGRGRALASGRNRSSTSTWSPPKPVGSHASASSAIGTIATDIPNSSRNASTSLRSLAAASGTGEIPRLAEYLESIKNRTKSRTRLSPAPGRRPPDVWPGRLPLSKLLGTGSYPTPGVLVPLPTSATATGGKRILLANFTVRPSGTGAGSALRHYFAYTNSNMTDGRNSQRAKPYNSSVGFSLSGFNTSIFNQTNHNLSVNLGDHNRTNCSGSATSTVHVMYEVITSTILVNETITLGRDATTPLPVFITPPPACQILTAPCEGAYCPPSSSRHSFPPIYGPIKGPPPNPPINLTPYTPSTVTSTLLVTKKTAAVVQELSAVGNLFGPSTPNPSAIAAQPNSDGQQATGQKSGSSNLDMSTQSDDSSPQDPDVDGKSPNESIPQQNPNNDNSPSVYSNSQNSDSQKPAAGSKGSQSTKNGDQTASNDNGRNGAASNLGDISSNGHASGDGDISSSGANLSNGDMSTDGATASNGKVSKAGDASNDEGVSDNRGSSGSEGGTSSNGAVPNNGKGSNNEESREPEAGSSANSHGAQNVPSVVMAGSLPVSIVSDAVIVGSHTVLAGSRPTTVVASGQTIAIQPSQIVAQGKTIPIQAAVTPLPANSLILGNVPIVLRPQDVKLGSKTFEHGSSPTSVLYNGQTYSWDASHFVGPGATVSFPSVDSAPRVTAGGQVFFVLPSQLKAPGRNIPLPSIATASPFVYKGRTFSVNPSQIIAPDTSITLPPARKITSFVYIDHTLSVDASQFMARSTTVPLSSGSGIVTYNGQVLTIKPSKVIGPSTTIALSAPGDSAALLTAVTTGGLTFSIGPSAAVVGSSTYSFVPGKGPATIMTHDEAVLVGSNGVQFKNIHVPIPSITASFAAITQEGLAFSIAPSEVVVGGHTDKIHSDMVPIITVVDGHTISIGPKGVGLASTTIPLPTPKPSFSLATEGHIIFSVAHSEVVVKGKTYSIASNKQPITTVVDGQNMTIGPKGIHIKGTTVNLPAIQTQECVTAAGLTFFIGATDAVLNGTTYAIGRGALLQTIVVGSQTMEIGSAGVKLPSTTIVPKQTPVAVTAAGLTLSMDFTQAVINGTTYAIGVGAVAKTLVRGSITMVLGTDGVALPSTTIRPWSSAMQTNSSSVLSTFSASTAAIATRPLTPIVTGKEVLDRTHAAGVPTRVPNRSTILGLVLGILMPGLWLNQICIS